MYRSFFMCLRRVTIPLALWEFCEFFIGHNVHIVHYIGCKIPVGRGLAPAVLCFYINTRKTTPVDPRWFLFVYYGFYFSTTLPPLLAEA